jgi:hypothetical protein
MIPPPFDQSRIPAEGPENKDIQLRKEVDPPGGIKYK